MELWDAHSTKTHRKNADVQKKLLTFHVFGAAWKPSGLKARARSESILEIREFIIPASQINGFCKGSHSGKHRLPEIVVKAPGKNWDDYAI